MKYICSDRVAPFSFQLILVSGLLGALLIRFSLIVDIFLLLGIAWESFSLFFWIPGILNFYTVE